MTPITPTLTSKTINLQTETWRFPNGKLLSARTNSKVASTSINSNMVSTPVALMAIFIPAIIVGTMVLAWYLVKRNRRLNAAISSKQGYVSS